MKYVQNQKKKNLHVSITLLGGVSLNSLSYEGRDELNTSGNYASQYNYGSSLNPSLGISVDFSPKRKFNPLTLYVDANWKQVGKYTASNNVTDVFSDRRDYSIDFSYVNANIGIKYFLIKNSKLSPFLKLGAGLSMLLNQNSSMIKTSFNVSQKLEPLLILESSGISISTSIGCQLSNHFQIECCYNLTKFQNTGRYELITHSPSLVVGYRILK